MLKQAKKPRRATGTRTRLIEAAAGEFEETGYDGTNSNKIAARAGFAPQTFYRHFTHKLEIFLAVYARWADEGMAAFNGARSAKQAARLAVRHHKMSLHFRRALRHLSVSEPDVRKARAANRLEQISRLRKRLPYLAQVDTAAMLANLLLVERMSDACAEGEFIDMDLTEEEAEAELARVMQAAFGRKPET